MRWNQTDWNRWTKSCRVSSMLCIVRWHPACCRSINSHHCWMHPFQIKTEQLFLLIHSKIITATCFLYETYAIWKEWQTKATLADVRKSKKLVVFEQGHFHCKTYFPFMCAACRKRSNRIISVQQYHSYSMV